MNLNNKHVVTTGGGSGIGATLASRFALLGARVVVADRDADGANRVAQDIDGLAVTCDVTKESDIIQLINAAQQHNGAIDLFCSNAGLCVGEPDHAASASNDVWQLNWQVHVMSHVYAARALLPAMIERGEGYFLQMASAAGLLCQIGDAAYTATKHAAVSFAESLAVSHGDDGIKVSVICPQYVATPLLGLENPQQISSAVDASEGLITTDVVADAVIQGIEQERFLILPHPQVSQYIQYKSADYDKWLVNMRKLRQHILTQTGALELRQMHKLI
ncbi:MAG: SDR family oxidoreductase [Pseudomonadota bacterium]